MAGSHRWAHNRAEKLIQWTKKGISSSYVDSRDEYYPLPIPTIRLKYSQDVDEMAEDLEKWIAAFILGRPNIRIEVMEHTLSKFGSVHVEYENGSVIIDGPRTDPFCGNLKEGLEFLANNYWYSGGPEEEDEDYDY